MDRQVFSPSEPMLLVKGSPSNWLSHAVDGKPAAAKIAVATPKEFLTF
jgi:hypothetical protein